MSQRKKTSLDELKQKAEAGDSASASALGLILEIGLEGDPNVKSAREYYKIAANAGDEMSQRSLVEIIAKGLDGSKPNLSEAKALASQYAQSNQVRSQRVGGAQPIKKALLMDPAAGFRSKLKELLVSKGISVLEAANSVQALGMLRQNPEVNLVLTELDLPPHDGLALIRKMRGNGELDGLSIMVCTALKDASLVSQAKEAGINGWLMKPYDPSLVHQLLQRWTGSMEQLAQ